MFIKNSGMSGGGSTFAQGVYVGGEKITSETKVYSKNNLINNQNKSKIFWLFRIVSFFNGWIDFYDQKKSLTLV